MSVRVGRIAAIATHVLGIIGLVALGVATLLAYFEPCAAGALCSGVLPLIPRRSGGSARDLAAGDALMSITAALRAAEQIGRIDGERAGYVRGARAGRLAGFIWGLVIGALVVASSVYAGVIAAT